MFGRIVDLPIFERLRTFLLRLQITFALCTYHTSFSSAIGRGPGR